MSKIDLETLTSGYMDVQLLNRNFARIAEWSDTVLSRLGDAPNQMQADIDLNGYGLLNSTIDDDNPTSLVRYAAMATYVDQRAAGIVQLRRHSVTATAGQTVVTLPSFTYELGTDNISVYVNGVRKFSPTDYEETSDTSITFASAFAGGEKVEVFNTEFLGNMTLPPHTHVWTDILSAPATATRWPSWSEVTGKPTTFSPAAHNHSAANITSGRLADARRGVYVQSGAPASPQTGDLWIW